MPDAVLNGDVLVDSLVGVVDAVRSEIHSAMGTRPFRVYTVARSWTGDRVGEGAVSEVETEITPAPMVAIRGLHNEMRPAGPEEEGDVLLTRVSLTWSEDGLYRTGDDELVYRIDGGHGQGVRSRYYVPTKPPIPDRMGVGWIVQLRRVEDPGS